MAKVTITLEDNPAGGVKCVMTPSYDDMMRKMNRDGDITPAEAYGVFLSRKLLEEDMKQEKQQHPLLINVPRVRGRSY